MEPWHLQHLELPSPQGTSSAAATEGLPALFFSQNWLGLSGQKVKEHWPFNQPSLSMSLPYYLSFQLSSLPKSLSP